MKTSNAGLMALITREGIVLSRYLDSVNVWTIGVGHTAAAGEPDPKTFKGELTVSQAFELLRKDIAKYEAGVNRAVKVPLEQNEFDALVSFHYNTGAIGKASLTKTLNKGDKAGAGRQMMNWTKPKEITARRESERDQFLYGKYPEPFATILPATPAGKVLWGKGKSIDLRKALDAAPADPPKPSIPRPDEDPGPVARQPDDPGVDPADKPAEQAKTPGLVALVAAGVLVVLAGIWSWLLSLPCNLLGIFCG